LGQCSNYLSKILPNARRVAFPSTAHAATYLAAGLSSNITSAVSEQARVKLKEEGSLIREDGERPSGIGAAICSSAIAEQFKDSLEVVDTGIQNVKGMPS
jgi:prephenate dehydratase